MYSTTHEIFFSTCTISREPTLTVWIALVEEISGSLNLTALETYPSPNHPAVKPGHIVIEWQGTAEKQPLADAVSLVK